VAYLALLHCANDRDSFNRLFDVAAEQLLARGYRTVVGPTGLSPHLGSGLLQDYWNLIPPLHTPYQPPYLPEIISDSLRPKSRSQLYHLAIPAEPPSPHPGLAQLTRFNPTRLSTDLLLLLVAACPPWGDFAAPDKDEAAFMLRWVSRWPLYGWLAEVNERPVGFILLQPDLASILRQTKGGRHLLWRLWFNWASHKPSQRGRILFAGVLPEWRGQGIGRQLLHQAISTAQQQGWKSLSSGPLPSNAPANKFLKRHGAEPQQTYLLYQKEL
jgi:ribosomal protein S18 acetylase RimI-like enzyme